MQELNSGTHTVKVLTPYSFSIGDTSCYADYTEGGVACQLHRPKTVDFTSLSQQLLDPAMLVVDYVKFATPGQVLLGYRALAAFQAAHGGSSPKPWDATDAEEMLHLAAVANETVVPAAKVEAVDKDILRLFSYTCSGCMAPLCAAIGGWAAQEALKGLTGKFGPLMQMMFVDAIELAPPLDSDTALCQPRGDRYDNLRVCIGNDVCIKLADAKLFMVGCGAIGCEMLKNYALLGVGTAEAGKITITDNDLIEKSNLNRQFLFRPHHIQSPKSVVGAESAKSINKDMKIEAHQHKVGPETAQTVYTDTFFEGLDVVVNALDNLQARLFMDACAVRNQRPLLESGTMGAKGHVQVIIPHLSESYASQRDPPEADVPYCTLKSFPSTIEHTIQWVRMPFSVFMSHMHLPLAPPARLFAFNAPRKGSVGHFPKLAREPGPAYLSFLMLTLSLSFDDVLLVSFSLSLFFWGGLLLRHATSLQICLNSNLLISTSFGKVL